MTPTNYIQHCIGYCKCHGAVAKSGPVILLLAGQPSFGSKVPADPQLYHSYWCSHLGSSASAPWNLFGASTGWPSLRAFWDLPWICVNLDVIRQHIFRFSSTSDCLVCGICFAVSCQTSCGELHMMVNCNLGRQTELINTVRTPKMIPFIGITSPGTPKWTYP